MPNRNKSTVIVADDAKVVTHTDIAEYVMAESCSVADAARHFECSPSFLRDILNEKGVKPSGKLTLWDGPDGATSSADGAAAAGGDES